MRHCLAVAALLVAPTVDAQRVTAPPIGFLEWPRAKGPGAALPSGVLPRAAG